MDSSKDQVLALIRDNPFVSQQELATRLGLSRSAVAGHIATLTREHRLLGRAYVLAPHDQQAPLVCIGGSNVDRKLRSLAGLRPGTSNPATQTETPGGVARNVAENLARLGLPTRLLTAVGEDASGRELLEHAALAGVDCSASLRLADAPTGSYTAVLDAGGELLLALSQMELCERLTPEFMQQTRSRRAPAGLLMADLNLPAASLRALVAEARESGQPLVLVAVSVPKMARLPRDLRGVHCLLLNEAELAALAGSDVPDEVDPSILWKRLRRRGLRQLIVTRGSAGLLYSDGDTLQAMSAPAVPVVDVTGAGDAFAAGVCAALQRDAQDLARACRCGLALAALTLQTEATVSPKLEPALLDAIT